MCNRKMYVERKKKDVERKNGSDLLHLVQYESVDHKKEPCIYNLFNV